MLDRGAPRPVITVPLPVAGGGVAATGGAAVVLNADPARTFLSNVLGSAGKLTPRSTDGCLELPLSR